MAKSNYKENPNFPKVGAMILKQEVDELGNAAYYIKINENADVRINGKKVTSLNIQRPTDKFYRMVEKGSISEVEFEEQMAKYDDKSSPKGEYHYVKFEISADLRDPSEKKKK